MSNLPDISDSQSVLIVGGIIKKPLQNENGWYVYRLRSTQQNASTKRTLYFNVLVNPELQKSLNTTYFSQVKITGILCPPSNYENLPTLADIIADTFESLSENSFNKKVEQKNFFDYTTIKSKNLYGKQSLAKTPYTKQLSNLKNDDTLESKFTENN